MSVTHNQQHHPLFFYFPHAFPNKPKNNDGLSQVSLLISFPYFSKQPYTCKFQQFIVQNENCFCYYQHSKPKFHFLTSNKLLPSTISFPFSIRTRTYSKTLNGKALSVQTSCGRRTINEVPLFKMRPRPSSIFLNPKFMVTFWTA